jgi:hypothetical protein
MGLLLDMLAGFLPALVFVALSFVLTAATPPYRSFSEAKDA